MSDTATHNSVIAQGSSNSKLAGSLAALAVLGISTITYSVVQSRAQKRKAQEIFLSKSAKKNKFSVEDDIAPFLRK